MKFIVDAHLPRGLCALLQIKSKIKSKKSSQPASILSYCSAEFETEQILVACLV